MGKGASSEKVVREIHRRTRRRFSAEEKIRIILDGLRGEESIAELCRRVLVPAGRQLRSTRSGTWCGCLPAEGAARFGRESAHQPPTAGSAGAHTEEAVLARTSPDARRSTGS